MAVTTANRNIDDLKPAMAGRVREWLKLCAANGLEILITETARSKPRQMFLWAKGRVITVEFEKGFLGYDDPAISSKPGEKQVTWTLKSKHVDGEAIDFGFLQNGIFTYVGNWEKAYDLAESVGLTSLFRKEGIDRPHLEFNHSFVQPDPAKKAAIARQEAVLAERAKTLNSTLEYYNQTIKNLSDLKGVPFIPYIITRSK